MQLLFLNIQLKIFETLTVLKCSVVFFFIFNNVQTTSSTEGLPKYIKACHRNDPNLAACALKQAKLSSARFAKGDSERGNPSLDPLYVKEIRAGIYEGSLVRGIRLNFSDVVLTGLSNMDVTDLQIDISKQMFTIHMKGNIRMDSKYELYGFLYFIPFSGSGFSNISLTDISLVYTFDYNVSKGPNGREYAVYNNDAVTYSEIANASFFLENVFYGFIFSGDRANRYINENWQEILKELAPRIINVLMYSFSSAARTLLSQVPYDELFLP